MESSPATRTAVDIGPSSPKPGLALVLGILAVPGSTVAWDLPAGGLWIGLPLCIAAIVVGMQARREGARGGRSAMAVAGMVLAGLALAQMAIWTLVSTVG